MCISHHCKEVDYPVSKFIRQGLAFIAGEYRFMVHNGAWYQIPYAVCYDFMKFLGLFLGTKEKYMPRRMKRKLCKKKNHWDTYQEVIKRKVILTVIESLLPKY